MGGHKMIVSRNSTLSSLPFRIISVTGNLRISKRNKTKDWNIGEEDIAITQTREDKGAKYWAVVRWIGRIFDRYLRDEINMIYESWKFH